MQLKTIKINNILSIGDAEISFGDSGLVLLDGWNHDDNTANGAGKTSIFNSVCFALYGKLPRKITASEILRKGAKSGYVSLSLQVDETVWEITRRRPTALEIKKNGELQNNMSQEELESSLKLSYDQFLICVYSSQIESQKLVSLNDSSKKDFFLQLMNLDEFSDRKKQVDDLIKDSEKELVDVEKNLAKLDTKYSIYKEQLIDVTQVRSDIKDNNIDELLEELKSIGSIKPLDLSKFDLLEDKIHKQSMAYLQKQEDAERATIKLIKLRSTKYSPNITCPHCSISFSRSGDGECITEDVFKNQIAELESEYSNIIADYESIKDDFNKILENRDKIHEKKKLLVGEYKSSMERQSQLKEEISIKKVKLSSLNDALSAHNDAKNKLDQISSLLVKCTTAAEEIKQTILVYEAISKALSPSGAQAYVVDSAIDVFNNKISQYISMIWPNAQYRLQSFKENKNGDIKAKFSDQLLIQGTERSVGGLSGGEYRCLSLAIDFAIIDTVEGMFGIKINPILMDEPFEGLDIVNREKAIEILEDVSQNRQIWLVDHASEVRSLFSNIYKIEKRNGISTIS